VFAAAADDYAFLWFLLVVAVILGLAFYYQKKRRQDLARAAAELGFQFETEETKVPLPNQDFENLPLFGRARNRENFLFGRRSTGAVFLADVRVGSGKSSYSQTVACFHLAERRLPAFDLSPEHWAHKIAQAFGYKDIDFESSPEFSKHYLLRGEDEDAVRRLFGADLLNFFTGEKGWTVEGADNWLCIYRHARTVSAKDIRSFLEQAEAVAQPFARSRW
jgi:hypothetical protein